MYQTKLNKLTGLNKNDRAALAAQSLVVGLCLVEMNQNYLVKNGMVNEKVGASINNAGFYCTEAKKRIVGNYPELEETVLTTIDLLLELAEGLSFYKTPEQREKYLEYLKNFSYGSEV
jgi:hypothetical protein